MISLSCPSCHLKLKVKDHLAGKKVRCPQCKQSVSIPTGTVAFEPANPASRLFAEDATVPPRLVPDRIDNDPAPAASEPAPDRNGTTEAVRAESVYEVSSEIARGGMGAIMRAVDHDIQREVAVKFLLNHADAKQKARFVEEAQITGQLEHPNIVPIHQLGVHEDGRCFFSMKMVKGRSLAEILKDPATEYSLVRSLNILAGICNALSYAHSRNVIHRDLKPANIMVGDFGEVYVMDWGLAKVLGGSSEPDASARVPGSDSSKITTNRHLAGDLTQAGAIMGTPVYMPPEQAQGAEVDQRSDLYSLGAILYEMMTLTPPVGRGGDMLAILMRVIEGQIDAPHKRAPERARVGWIPSELSAIAMKALAKEPADRYQTVEAFRRDLELFLEGRSVSAKHDSSWEQGVKFVKRNKAFSGATGLALVVLAVVLSIAFRINSAARVHAEEQRHKAETAYTSYQQEQGAKEATIRRAVPALVRAGRQLANEGQSEQARAQVELALGYAPNDPDAHLLKGQIFIAHKQWPQAQAELQECLRQQPDNSEASKLLGSITNKKLEDPNVLFAVAVLLQQQKVQGLAISLLQDAKAGVVAHQKLLPLYRKQIEARWPDLGKLLTLTKDGQFSLDFGGQVQVDDLSGLRGIPVHTLDLAGCNKIKDFTPLQGMPLTSLILDGCRQVSDLTPLQGLPLTRLQLIGCGQVSDLTPLQGMPLTYLHLRHCHRLRDLTPLQGMPLTSLGLTDCGQVSDLTPLQGLPLTSLVLTGSGVRDLTPLQGLSLTGIGLSPKNISKGMDVLRQMKSLKGIGPDGKLWLRPEEFWKKYDAGEFKK